MRPGAKRNLISRLRALEEEVASARKAIEEAEPQPIRWTVAHGSGGTKILLGDDRELSEAEVEELVTGAIWALFERIRPAHDPSCPYAFSAVIQRVFDRARERVRPREPAREPAKEER